MTGQADVSEDGSDDAALALLVSMSGDLAAEHWRSLLLPRPAGDGKEPAPAGSEPAGAG